ncbi:uncharacterized protein BX664DRAFT_99634 [Halteromyces radiatus]|uniref:uncharacterized protein n=1 Tax=Halteromyces radiatus TaxID=101107 RepID=UPI00221E601C|nr:uncharacterized protein BX664DRAFT_99634 [Halteromyces radiatus]KAI8093049.1 hypothetical protein BX664DRAFT_99634 [Halteromyces radiatus]
MRPPTVSKHLDQLSYLDDYIDTIEALPLELQRNFTLMRELDGYAQELMDTAASQAIDLIDNIKEMDNKRRIEKLKLLDVVLTETLKRGEEKVALAKSTFDAVDRHCNRLDANLVKLEEDHPVGNLRITSYPGLEPSSRNLRESMEFREKSLKRLERERKEMKPEKKKRKIKDGNPGTPPPGNLIRTSQNAKDQRTPKSQDKTRPFSTGKSKKTSSNSDMNIDPNEPLYCYCQQVSFGEMVACDNADCDIEWFHLACVDLKTVPKGKWYCDNCSSKSKGKQQRK